MKENIEKYLSEINPFLQIDAVIDLLNKNFKNWKEFLPFKYKDKSDKLIELGVEYIKYPNNLPQNLLPLKGKFPKYFKRLIKL